MAMGALTAWLSMGERRMPFLPNSSSRPMTWPSWAQTLLRSETSAKAALPQSAWSSPLRALCEVLSNHLQSNLS